MARYFLMFLLIVGLVGTEGNGNSSKRQAMIDVNGSWRVVGGSDAGQGVHPHQISLRRYNSHVCGGSIVHPQWIITAAHCVVGSSPKQMSIVVGSTTLSKGGKSYAVIELHYNQKYDAWRLQNDVALIKVEPITFEANVESIVVETEDVGSDEPCMLSGWGTTSYPGSIPDKLQHINLTTISVDECFKIHGRNIVKSQICTLTKRGEGACHGDSGGPLTRIVDGVPKLIGIVSWGRPCAAGYPDVFTRVSSFINWSNEICDNCLNN